MRSRAIPIAGVVALIAALAWFVTTRNRTNAPARSGASTPTCDCAGAAGAPAAATTVGHPEPAQPAPTANAVEAVRYSVCEREETRAVLTRVELLSDRAALWALHCGRGLHLIAFAELGGSLVPQRVAVVHGASPSPGQAPTAVAAGAADVDGDGHADWIAPMLFADARGEPRGGGLYVLRQRAAGGFDAPMRLLAAAPGSVVAAELDGQAGRDLVLLHRQDSSGGRPDELWLVHGGPAPLRTGQRPASAATDAIAALDLDLDGRDDLVAASAHEGRILIWRTRGGALAQVEPSALALPGVRQLLAIDRSGGRRALVLVGEQSWLLAQQADGPPAPAAILGSEGLRDLHVVDADGDGDDDLVGYAHPELIALLPDGERFARKRAVALRGEASVLFARIAQLDADPRPDLVMALLAAEGGREVELAVARNLVPDATVRFAAAATQIAEAALLQRFTIP